MIVAIPIKPPSTEIRRTAERHGFLTFPHFLDNGFIIEGKPSLKWINQNLRRYGCGLIRFAVAPDHMLDEALELKREWPDINWVFPLHSLEEDISEFDWVGFPQRDSFRDYELKTFLNLTKKKKKWYLGFWEQKKPEIMFLFDGLDTMIPYFHATKLGVVWYGWNKTKEVGHLKIPNNELFEYNLIGFKIAVKELEEAQARNQTLKQFWGEQSENMPDIMY